MSSMAEVFTLAERHLQTNVVAKAAAAARAHFVEHPEEKIDINAIADATAAAFKADSLLQFLQGKTDAIEEKVQPNIRGLVPPPDDAASTSVPSYPTDLALEIIDSYHDGAQVVWPGPLPLPPSSSYRTPSDDESIAMQRLISEEVKKGILVLLTWDDLLELAAQQGVEVHASPTNLVGKSDDAKARKADDYTRGGVNSKDKGKVLEATHGPYNDPNCASLCTQYYVAKNAFPGQPISMLKSDYSAYFKRIPVNINDVLKLVTRVTIDGVVYAAIPLTHPFGLQDSNAHAKTLTEVMHAINRAFDLQHFGVSLRTTYVDDTVAFGPVHVLQLIKDSQIVTADRVIGPHGTNLKKTEIASILTVLGYLFNLEEETVALTSIWFTKLVCTLFHELPAAVAVDQPVYLHQLQRTAAYMLRSSTIIRGMKPFSHGIYRNIRGLPPAYTGTVPLTPDSVTDIREWREFILSLWDNASLLRCPMSIPPLLHRLPGQDRMLISEEVKKGILVLLTWDDLLELAAQQGVEVHASPTNLVGKSDDAKARKADDYTRGGVNSKDKGKVLEATHGPYNDPNCASLCTQYYVAKNAFPGQPISMLKSDYSAYFKRIPVNINDVLKLVTRVTIDGVVYAAIPLTHPFGLQDSNAHAKTLTEVMHAINRAFDLQHFGVSLRTTYVDDTVAFGPVHVLQLIKDSQIVTADRVIGPHGTNLKKTEIASILTVLGYLFNLEEETVALTSIWFTKLVCTLFHELPAAVAVDQPVYLHQLQRTAAYMLRSSTIIRGMKPFSHGIYRNIRGLPPAYTGTVPLTPDSVTDIREWREFILSLWDNASLLRCPMSIPPLLHRLPGQDRTDLWHQQAAHAHDVLHVDASGLTIEDSLVGDIWGGGWVASYPDGQYSAYGEYILQRLSLSLDSVSFGDVDQINVLEFLIALVAIDELTRRGRPSHLPPDAVWHVHCWTDNTTALSWLTKHKSSHPLVLHLLHVYTRLQVNNHMLLTMGHIPGVKNVVADALSRQYCTPQGEMVRQVLSHLVPHRSLPNSR